MDFTSPGNDASVVARDSPEDQDINLSGTEEPIPILASTAHNIPKDNQDMINKIRQLADMAGSYLDLKSGSGSELRESDAQLREYIKSNFSDNNSSASSHSGAPKLSSGHDPNATNSESSLSMLDMEQMKDNCSLVHVESNVSLGSWLGDVMPERSNNSVHGGRNSPSAENQGDDSGQIICHYENTPSKDASKLNSRYFMTDSQLGGFSGTPDGTPSRSVAMSRTEDNMESSGHSHPNFALPNEENNGAACPFDSFLPDDGGNIGMTSNFFGDGMKELGELQQQAFADAEFTGDIANILDQDEAKFEEDHKLMLYSNAGEEEMSVAGFTTLNDSPTKMEYFEPKMSIGTYMAERSEKMGKLEPFDRSWERPSFGWSIKSPPPRHALILQTSIKSSDTFCAESNDASASGENITLTKDTTDGGTVEAEPPQEKGSDDGNRVSKQDVTSEQDLVSVSAAFMNMSTSVTNEEVAQAIIELTKKKQMRLNEAKSASHRLGDEKSSCSETSSRSSLVGSERDLDEKSSRKSKIPISVKSISPPKATSAKGNSSVRRLQPIESRQSRSSASSVTSDQPHSDISEHSTTLLSKEQPVEDAATEKCSESKELPCAVVAKSAPVATSGASQPGTDLQKSVSADMDREKYWNNLMQESFMHDNPEQDRGTDKSSAVREQLGASESGRVSSPFQDDASDEFLLSSTRVESSLLRGSLSRESIEQLHKKLRVQSSGNIRKPSTLGSESLESDEKENAGNDYQTKDDNGKSGKDFGEAVLWKAKDLTNRASSVSSSETVAHSRFSEDFQEMLPSMTMSFGEMATAHEIQFDPNETDTDKDARDNVLLPKSQKLCVIQEEAETTQDTVFSARSSESSGSGESQIPSEISHPAQHSTTIAAHPAHINQNMFLPYPHIAYPPSAPSLSSTSLPNMYKNESRYGRAIDGAYHSVPLDYHHGSAPVFPHSYSGYPAPAPPYAPMHNPLMQFGYDQRSVAFNQSANAMYQQPAYMHHMQRSVSSDGRLTPDMYRLPAQVRQFEGLTVPSELSFPHARCAPLTTSAKLALVNKSDRWLQAEINVLSPTIDSCFAVDAKPIIGPHETKTVEITFSPKLNGKFEGILEVASFLVAPDGSYPQPVRPVTSLVNLKASAESPKAEFVFPDGKKVLDFGEVQCESTRQLPLKLRNKGSVEVPVCVILCAKSLDRRCFGISTSRTMDWQDQEKPNQSILRTTLYPGNESTTVWVHCKIPPKYSDASQPPVGISAQIYMELDVTRRESFDAVVLDTVPVELTACVAKLHVPKNLQPLNFKCARDSTQAVAMPVKNCGNVSSKVAFDMPDNEALFALSPRQAMLAPGEQVEVSITWRPGRATPSLVRATLLMKIEPNGTKYEITINAACTEASNSYSVQQGFQDAHGPIGDMPSLLTNKSHLCWGGVAVGQSLQQRVVLRTSKGANRPLQMRLMIKGADAGCFQILREDDSNSEELCSRQEIMMLPGHDKVIRVLYGPTKCKMTLGKLEIKAPVDQVPSTKFTIPLSGYGGRSDVRVEDLEMLPKEDGRTHPIYVADAFSCDGGRRLTVKFTVKNTSSRCAFMKTVLYSDRDCLVSHPASNATTPTQFIIPKQTCRVVNVTLDKSQLQRTGCSRDGRDLLGSLCMWHGEEIGRRLLKNALGKIGPSSVAKCLPESDPLRGVAFDGIFEGEGLHETEEDLTQVKPQFGDVQVFYSSVKKTVVEILGPRSKKPLLEMVEPGRTRQDTASSKATLSRSTLFKRPPAVEVGSDNWDVSPDHVVLYVPRLADNAGPTKVKIVNRSKHPLKFDAAWSRNYLTITPHCGQVEPETALIVLLNANPSLATRRDELPWVGSVQISTQNGRDTKQLRVQVRDHAAAGTEPPARPSSPGPVYPLQARYCEVATLDSFSTPMATSGTSRISEPTKSLPADRIALVSSLIEFGSVPMKSCSKSYLEFTNVCSSTIRWILTSFAPAYVKSGGTAGDLYRTTYAAFIFSHTSGLLETGVKVKVPATFSPIGEGQYSQFWDLEHHEAADTAALSLSKVRIQVNGQGIASKKGPQPVPQAVKAKEHGLYVSEDNVRFPPTVVNDSSVIKIPVKNRSRESHNVKFLNVRPPFHITHQGHTIRPMSYACLPVTFKPAGKGVFDSTLVIQAEGVDSISVQLSGKGV